MHGSIFPTQENLGTQPDVIATVLCGRVGSELMLQWSARHICLRNVCSEALWFADFGSWNPYSVFLIWRSNTCFHRIKNSAALCARDAVVAFDQLAGQALAGDPAGGSVDGYRITMGSDGFASQSCSSTYLTSLRIHTSYTDAHSTGAAVIHGRSCLAFLTP